MSTVTLTFEFYVDGSLTDATSVVLRDPTGAYGVKRDDTDATVVAADTAMTHSGTGLYTYVMTEPAAGLTYTYWPYATYDLVPYSTSKTFTASTVGLYRLITLANAKTYLGVSDSDHDTEIGWAIDAATDYIEKHCRYKFIARDYTQWIDGTGDSILELPQRPLNSVSQVSTGQVQGMTVKCADTAAAQAFVSVSTTAVTVTIHGGANEGSTASTFASNATLTAMETAIEAVAGTWTVTVLSDYGSMRSSLIRPCGGRFCLDNYASLDIPDQGLTDYEVEFDEGCLIRSSRFPSGESSCFVAYNAGYAIGDLPAEVVQVCRELIAFYFNQVGGEFNPALSGETLGDYTWRRFSQADEGKQWSRRLAPFMRGGIT